MAGASSNERIIEVRTAQMVPRGGGGRGSIAQPRTGYFLTPSVTSDVHKPICPLSSGSNFSFNERNLMRLKVNFNGWKNLPKNWETWVEQMRTRYQLVWERAGIYEAVMNSVHVIHKDEELIFALVEKWCAETSSFLFPWGEATITLEDVMILGGYSVLGDPIFSSLRDDHLIDMKTKLSVARSDIWKTKAKKVTQFLWLNKFMSSGDIDQNEHEAFLALWLSRFVFPTSDDTISEEILRIAVLLANGNRIALAPAVLTSLYSNLRKLKEALVASSSVDENANPEILKPKISAPFQLVQIWIWERFSELRPSPNADFQHNQPRFAKWKGLRSIIIANVKLAMANAECHFMWMPYTVDSNSGRSLLFHKIYQGNETQPLIALDMDDEQLRVIIRCLRVCELVGIDRDCIEQYLPHRVATQFGMDQDIPGDVTRANKNKLEAWETYIRLISDGELLFPPCLNHQNNYVTKRYFDWWRSLNAAKNDDSLALRLASTF